MPKSMMNLPMVPDDPAYLAKRYGTFWHNLDMATAAPPPCSADAAYLTLLPWAGNGGFSKVIGSGNICRLWVEPWNSTRPLQTYTAAPGTTIIGPTNQNGNADSEISFTASASLVNYGYQNITLASSGFANTDINYFMGGYIELTAYIDQNSRGSVNIIGQNEVRGIGIGPVDVSHSSTMVGEGTALSGSNLESPARTDFVLDSSVTTLGGPDSLKAPTLLVIDNQNQNQKLFASIPIVPPKFGMQRFKANVSGNDEGSDWALIAGRIAKYTNQSKWYDPVSATDIVVTTCDGTGYPPLAAGTYNIMTFDNAGTANAALSQYVDSKQRMVRATQNPQQSLMAGFPMIEIACTAGNVTIDVRFKLFFQIHTGITHPSYELASFGNYTMEDEIHVYQLYSAPVAGISFKSREDAIQKMKEGALYRATAMKKNRKKHLMEVLRSIQVSDHRIPASAGITAAYTEDDDWVNYILQSNLLGGSSKVRVHETASGDQI